MSIYHQVTCYLMYKQITADHASLQMFTQCTYSIHIRNACKSQREQHITRAE